MTHGAQSTELILSMDPNRASQYYCLVYRRVLVISEQAHSIVSVSIPLPLQVGPLKCTYGTWGSAVSSPSRVWGGAPAEIYLGAF